MLGAKKRKMKKGQNVYTLVHTSSINCGGDMIHVDVCERAVWREHSFTLQDECVFKKNSLMCSAGRIFRI